MRGAFECPLEIAGPAILVRVMLAQPTRPAVYGPVRTVVWQGSAGDRRPYADQSVLSVAIRANGVRTGYFGFGRAGLTGFGHGGRYRREHAQPGANGAASLPASVGRSEERRVGKECTSRCSAHN